MQLPSRPLKPATPPAQTPPPAAAETQNDALEGQLIPAKKPFHQPKRPQGHRISRKLRAAIVHVAQGMNITQAAAKAGMHRNGLSQAMGRPYVVALLEQCVRAQLAASAGKASMQLDTLIGDARSEYVRLEASKAVLDRAGYAAAPASTVAGDIVIQIAL
jgi:hypothetical protein